MMNRLQLARRVIHLQNVGEQNGLIVSGFLRGTTYFMRAFAAGHLEPEPQWWNDDLTPRNEAFSLFYKGYDGERSVDVSDMSDIEFIALMRSEPAGLEQLETD